VIIPSVPIYEEDGTIKCVVQIPPEQAKVLLQFALNFMMHVGLAGVSKQEKLEFND
jgi:hypothetical protein